MSGFALGRGPTTGLGRIFEPPPEQDVADELAAAYADDAREHGLEVQAGESFIDWVRDVPEPKRPLDLERFAFQRELYSVAGESDREIMAQKGAQEGLSAWAIRLAFRWADQGLTVLYVMPRERQANEFGTMRITPVLRASRYLRHRQKAGESPTDTKRLKSIGAGYFALRGSKSEDELISVDADAVILDEYDRLVQANLPRVEQRVTGPLSRGLIRRLSTPTIPNYGIDREMRRSDNRWWLVRCGGLDRRGRRRAGCGTWTPMKGTETFVEVLDHATATLRCPSCRRELDVREGQWVAEYTDGDRPRGYHLPKFVVPGIDLRGLINRSKGTKETQRRAHHNEDLGEAWQAEGAGLTDEHLAGATRPYGMEPNGYYGWNLVTMGVDVAASRALNVRISEHIDEHTKRALWIGEVDDGRAPWGGSSKSAWEILAEIMDRFRVRMAVVDHMPDPRIARAWCERFRGRAFRVSWSDSARAVLSRQDPKGDPTKLTARYLEGIDATLDLVRRQANLLPEIRPEDYDAHMKARVLATVEPDDDSVTVSDAGSLRSSAAEIRQAWIKTGADDYLQAEAYDVIATHMAYVQQAAGEIGGQDGQVVARGSDVVAEADTWRDDSYSEGPSDEPMSGWD